MWIAVNLSSFSEGGSGAQARRKEGRQEGWKEGRQEGSKKRIWTKSQEAPFPKDQDKIWMNSKFSKASLGTMVLSYPSSIYLSLSFIFLYAVYQSLPFSTRKSLLKTLEAIDHLWSHLHSAVLQNWNWELGLVHPCTSCVHILARWHKVTE